MILAGAGSGKTRVLTSRIVHLVQDQSVPLSQILAMTFSNKAAREMHDRVKEMMGDHSPLRYPWISTFHSVCVRLLRRYGSRIGIPTNFVIYDSNDQLDLIKQSFKSLNISDKAFSPKAIHARISNWKNEAKFPDQVHAGLNSHMDEVALDVYRAYQAQLKESAGLDFDDLLLWSLDLFHRDEELKNFLHQQWSYVLVDEFQDTNKIQYQLLKEFLNPNQNICVVGDDDQSIYGWRGARVQNILNFDKEFPGCRVIKLEQNYRSTSNILKAAASVIGRNSFRHEKTLWTSQGDGDKIAVANFPDDKAEARFVIKEILSSISSGTTPKSIAVLYRINSVSRNFEEECLRQGLPYKIVGGFRFYERKEIKDILSYLRLMTNPADFVSFRRSVNEPSRGIGKKSVEKIEAAARERTEDILSYLLREDKLPLSGKAKIGMEKFQSVMRWGQKALEEEASLTDLFVGVMEDSQYLESLRSENTEDSREREANLQELLSAVQEFEEAWMEEESESKFPEGTSLTQKKLFDFLERVALISDVDQLDEKSQDQVTFMSVHAAKGLEFDLCFVSALEEGVFPSTRSFDQPDQLEEERRLMYVAMTRAKRRLILTHAESRRTFGQINFQMPSRFLDEIDPKVIERKGKEARASFVRSRSVAYEDYSQDVYDYEFEQDRDFFNWNRGDRVKHPSFGEGVVQRVETLGSDECLTIDFFGKGRKRVLSQYVQRAP